MRRKFNENHDPDDGRFAEGDGGSGGGSHAREIDAAIAIADDPEKVLVAISRLQDLRREAGDGDAAARIDDAIAKLKERTGPKKSVAPGAYAVYR
jgi:hypothetical protein